MFDTDGCFKIRSDGAFKAKLNRLGPFFKSLVMSFIEGFGIFEVDHKLFLSQSEHNSSIGPESLLSVVWDFN